MFEAIAGHLRRLIPRAPARGPISPSEKTSTKESKLSQDAMLTMGKDVYWRDVNERNEVESRHNAYHIFASCCGG